MNAVNNLDKTDVEYSLAATDDLIRFWRSKANVTAGHGKCIQVDTVVSESILRFILCD